MAAERKKPEIQTLDDLFGIPTAPAVNVPDGTEYHETVVSMPIAVILDFANHPYRVRDDSITRDIVQDIGKVGRIETPAIVRPVPDGYEMISGHRRKLACSLAGLDTMPVIVRNMTDDEAVIAMVSANRQREQVLPSEKAFAYKMWMDAMNRQGERTDLTLSPVDTKLDSGGRIAQETGESRPQIFRYIRLTELIPQLLELVDNGVSGDKTKPQMAFRPAVELSYLTPEQQADLLQTIESEDRTVNRVKSSKFPNTLTEVLQQPGQYGYGNPAMTGDSIFNADITEHREFSEELWERCMTAAQRVADGTSRDENGDPWPGNVLFQHSFSNPEALGTLFKSYSTAGYTEYFCFG